jgi:hypothetical protein
MTHLPRKEPPASDDPTVTTAEEKTKPSENFSCSDRKDANIDHRRREQMHNLQMRCMPRIRSRCHA